MFAKEYFERCNEDTKKFVRFYMEFMYKISLKNSDVSVDYIPKLRKTKEQLEYFECAKFYFLLLLLKTYPEIFSLFEEYNVNLKPMLVVSEKAINYMNELYNQNYVENLVLDNYSQLLVFHYFNNFASSLIMAYSPYDRKICVERILINFIKDNKEFLGICLNNEGLLKELEKMALEKETGIVKRQRVVSDLDLEMGEVLTDLDYPYNPLIGREKELRKMYALLMDKEKSLIIHGKPGVGKTALVKGMAYNIVNGDVPSRLCDKNIIELSGSELVSGCRYVGMVEERLLNIINKLIATDNNILFIDEIHTLMGLGAGEKEINDVSNILKPYLGDGRLKIIGATTTDEYRGILENGAFARRFNGLELSVPTNGEVEKILLEVIKRFKETEGIDFFPDENLREQILQLIISFSNRKNPNAVLQKELYNPDLALTILRNGYDFAMVDDKPFVDADSLVEGVESMDYFRDSAKNEFKEKALALTRTKKDIYLIS